MNPEIDLDARPPKPSRPWFTTIVCLATIGGLIAMPYIAGESDGEKMPDMVRFLGRFHPMILHLPIGIFALILFQEVLSLFAREKTTHSIAPMFLGTVTAVIAAILGFLLYHGGGYEGNELAEDHLWAGIGFAGFAVLAFIIRSWTLSPESSQTPFRITLLLSVGVMGYASHDGASITHGSDYLLKYAPNPVRKLLGLELRAEKAPEKPVEERIVYADIVAPILEMRCVECHREEKSKGKFRMDTFDLLVKGGKEGAGLKPGNALDSNIVFRAELPEDDEEHMPPDDKKGFEDHELFIVKWWIDQGADPLKTAGELELNDEVRDAIQRLKIQAVSYEDPADEKATGPESELEKATSQLSNEFSDAFALDSKDPSKLTFTAVSLRNKLTDKEFAKLSPILGKLVSIDLSATAISDQSVALLSSAQNLETIRLTETAITDVSLETLVMLKNLESINLSGTKVTDAGVKKLATLPKLKSLYLWETEISEETISELREQLPELEIITES